MAVNWSRDVDSSIALGKEERRPLLIDFSAAPA